MSTSGPAESQRIIASGDRLLRPFLVAAFVAVVATQLVQSHASAVELGWVLFVPVALLALWTLLPPSLTPPVPRALLLAVLAVLAGILFAVPAGSYSAGFVFLAALSAGQLLESHRMAIGIAVLAAVSCAVSSLLAAQLSPEAWPWWLGLTAGLPVYIGIARRERAMALDAARRAAAEADRARASETREAALIERGRIAREIHDVLGHSLSAISIQLDMADAMQSRGRSQESLTALRRARALAKSGIGETRRAVHALQEDSRPLPETLQEIAASFGASFVMTGTPSPLQVGTAQTLIRAAQEALTNAHRHAPGATLETELSFIDDEENGFVELIVTNGPSAETARQADESKEGTGMGLQGMRERAELLGGTATAGPLPGTDAGIHEGGASGWVVTMRLPR